MMKTFILKSIFVASCGLLVSANAHAGENENTYPIPNAVVSLGDSITAALFADLDRNLLWNPFAIFSLMELLFTANDFGDVGEYESKEYSWATGSTLLSVVDSHYEILSRNGNVNRGQRNFGVSGQTVGEIMDLQIPAFHAWRRAHMADHETAYVTYLAGANDLCSSDPLEMTSVSQFARRVENSFESILQHNPNDIMLVSSIPNATTLYEVAAHETTLLDEEMTCEQFWRTFELCPTLTYKTSDPQIMERVNNRLLEFNSILDQKVNEMRARYGDRIRYVPETFEHEIDPNELSIDCFHPNIAGQARIAEETFFKTWWSNLK